MDKKEFNVRQILAGQAPPDAPVTVKGWVRTRRDSKAGISFVHLSDGSSFHPVQVVAPATLANYADEVQKLTAGCAIAATGTVVPSPAKGQPFELQASAIEVIGWVEDPDTYPIQPKPHTMEFLREVAHLRPRTNVIGAATRVRHTLAQAIHRFFDQNGFFWVNTPIITTSDAEGAGQLFRVSSLDLANLPRTPAGKIDFGQDVVLSTDHTAINSGSLSDAVNTELLNVGTAGTGVPTLFKNLPAIRFQADGTVDENSPQTLKLMDSDGFSRWLTETPLRTGYEISDIGPQ